MVNDVGDMNVFQHLAVTIIAMFIIILDVANICHCYGICECNENN